MRKLVIFGNTEFAQLAAFYFSHDNSYEVAAFTVDAAYMQGGTLWGKPLLPFEAIQDLCAPERHDMFIAVGYADMNRLREKMLCRFGKRLCPCQLCQQKSTDVFNVYSWLQLFCIGRQYYSALCLDWQ